MAKVGLDGDDRGLRIVARILRDAWTPGCASRPRVSPFVNARIAE